MRIYPLFALLVSALSVACGGSDDDGGGSKPTIEDTIVPGTEIEDTIVPGTEVADTIVPGSDGATVSGNNPIPIDIYSVQNPLYHGASVRDGAFVSGRFEYVLHGSEADIDAWLAPTDIVAERSVAGELTYARVLTTSVRHVPAVLCPDVSLGPQGFAEDVGGAGEVGGAQGAHAR